MSRDPLAVIAQAESAGKNVLNYKYGPGFSASGFYQIIDGTWRRWAKAAGIDISQYPRAIDAPKEVQDAVALQGFKMEGFKPWEATKHLVGQEGNFSTDGSTGAAYASSRGGGGIPAPGGVISTQGTASAPTAMPRNIHELEAQLKAEFPQLRVTSGYRSPEYNAKVGGAKDSQHTHGTAMDIGLRGLDAATQQRIVDRAVQLGAKGIGFYPNSTSIHLDMREGAPAAWGPNYSRTSLGQTPPWFQEAAQRVLQQTGSTGAAYPSRPGTPPGVPTGANGIPGGVRPADLPWGGGGIPAPPPGIVSTAGTAAAPAPIQPNSDAARALSDPSRYGADPVAGPPPQPPGVLSPAGTAAAPMNIPPDADWTWRPQPPGTAPPPPFQPQIPPDMRMQQKKPWGAW